MSGFHCIHNSNEENVFQWLRANSQVMLNMQKVESINSLSSCYSNAKTISYLSYVDAASSRRKALSQFSCTRKFG